MLGDTTDVSGFEKEISSQLANTSHMIVSDARDVEDLSADALKRRCCHSNNRRAALHMHLRLKKGDSQTTMTRHEMADLAEMVATKGAPNAIVKRLANFYVRIAMLRAQIEETRRSLDACCTDIPIINMNNMNNANAKHLRAAHAKNEESLCEKRNENQRELTRIMNALFLDASVGSIHPALTEDDLPALETQAQHIAERGCATQELRRLKIMEAALEQQRLDELMAELKRGTYAPP